MLPLMMLFLDFKGRDDMEHCNFLVLMVTIINTGCGWCPNNITARIAAPILTGL